MILIPKKVLIVEDDPSVLRATSYILEKEGYEVLTAQTIKEGMEPLKHDAMLKVKEGITTIPEVLRNVYSSNY